MDGSWPIHRGQRTLAVIYNFARSSSQPSSAFEGQVPNFWLAYIQAIGPLHGAQQVLIAIKK